MSLPHREEVNPEGNNRPARRGLGHHLRSVGIEVVSGGSDFIEAQIGRVSLMPSAAPNEPVNPSNSLLTPIEIAIEYVSKGY